MLIRDGEQQNLAGPSGRIGTTVWSWDALLQRPPEDMVAAGRDQMGVGAENSLFRRDRLGML